MITIVTIGISSSSANPELNHTCYKHCVCGHFENSSFASEFKRRRYNVRYKLGKWVNKTTTKKLKKTVKDATINRNYATEIYSGCYLHHVIRSP